MALRTSQAHRNCRKEGAREFYLKLAFQTHPREFCRQAREIFAPESPKPFLLASSVMAHVPHVDFLVIGAGVAGLRAAVELANHGDVLVVTKESLSESNTHYAQGGIAVAMEGDEDVALHLDDTVTAGDGLVYRPAAEVLVNEGPPRVAELIEWGANFDRNAGPEGSRLTGEYLRTREGAHSLPRILHSHGDATGAEISRALVAYARKLERIRFAEWTRVAALVVNDGRVVAADLASARLTAAGIPPVHSRVAARSILIAAGGAGQVYSDTTNPAVATGDGIGLATQSGAELADMEFYQFHPTALAVPGAPRFLISEALRGEGAYLRNDRGERFMERYDGRLELAPRDVVARAIVRESVADATAPPGAANPASRAVYLDMRHVRGVEPAERFPGISAVLAQYSLDLRRDLIPVGPAAHYLMGGIRSDLGGRASLGGLYAAGEAACTGVHGANRLASNSLLEGLVFGARAAQSMLADGLALAPVDPIVAQPAQLTETEDEFVETTIMKLQRAMWGHAGLLRDESSLAEGQAEAAECKSSIEQILGRGKASRRLSEAQSLCSVAQSILGSAVARTESRGAHFRNDHPRRDDANFQKHSAFLPDGKVSFETW
jgi:L-aspartate oxidase